jgi:DNA processing protein
VSGIALSDEQRIDWLRLIRSDRVGPRTFRALVNQFGGARPALDALPGLARKAGRGGLKVASRAEAEREIEALARMGGRFLAQGEPEYPRALLAIDTAPPMLAVLGQAAILSRPAVAIVGSRNASAAGGAFTERLAADLGREGFLVVSGLARGIDTRAHRAALAIGTVAVLAGGHDRVYPAENIPLRERILAEGGAIVTRCRSAGSRAAATSHAATASSRACPTASWLSRRLCARVPSSPPGSRWSRGARCSRCRARPSTRGRRARTT